MTLKEHQAMVAAYMQHGGEISPGLAARASVEADSCAEWKWISFCVAVLLLGFGIANLPTAGGFGRIVAGLLLSYAAHRFRHAERAHRAIDHAWMQRGSLRKLLGQ